MEDLFFTKIFIMIFYLLIGISLLLLVFSYFYYIFNRLFSKYFTSVYSSNNSLKKKLMLYPYFPTFFLPCALSQLIYFLLFPPIKKSYKREYLKTTTKDTISVDWVLPIPQKSQFILIIHGATGGSETRYLKSLVQFIKSKNDFKIAIAHYRGVNDTPLSTCTPYHPEIIEDTEFIINHFLNIEVKKFIIIGISMGGNIVSRILSHNPKKYEKGILGFISISNPFFYASLDAKNRFNLLDKFILWRYKFTAKKHEIIRANTKIHLESSLKTNTTHVWDQEFNMKLSYYKDYKDVYEYWINVSSGFNINKIQVPTLFINSLQDKLNCAEMIDSEKLCKENKNLNFIKTSHGGHVSWAEGFNPKRVRNYLIFL